MDSYDSPDAEALLLAGEERLRRRQRRRELTTFGGGAICFLLAAGLLAGLAPWKRSLSPSSLVLMLVVWVVVERVKFPVSSGWTRPTMLAFVPMLFVLPTPLVPLVAMVGILLRRAPEMVRRETALSVVPAFIVDSWFTMGPALVLVLTGAQTFGWAHWPVYVLALVAYLAFDIGAWLGSTWLAERVLPGGQFGLLTWTYSVDVTLAPLGLLIAAAAVQRPGLVLLALSPMTMLVLFARERQERLDHTLALSTAYRGTALLLGDVVEADDKYTGTHSRDVVDLSLAVADALELGPTQRQNVEFGALLHDVGKIRVPKEVLNKRGKLDAAETEILRRHTIDGEQMLKQVGGTLSRVGRIVRASHEWYDGSGYPDGLSGGEIPIESRIIAACDAYNAMSTDRPYRAALPLSASLAELRRGAGTQFDPNVVVALLSALPPQAPSPSWHGDGDPAALPADAVTDSTPEGAVVKTVTAVKRRAALAA